MALRADDVDLGRDRDLVARFQGGDPEAFDDLYRRYFDRLHRFCRRHTRDSHEAEEVAQEAFVRALRSMHSLEGERRFYPWMTVIAKRITIDRHRKDARVDLTDQPDLGSVEPDVDHLFAEVDAGHVRRALENLGPRHREVLLLREAEGMSYAAIADHLQVPMTTVEALLHRARKALRREYAAVSGERRGMLGLPLVAWLATKASDLRARLGEHWVEAGAVAGPLAVGAAAAAFVLVPSAGPADDADARTPVLATAAASDAPADVADPVDWPGAVEVPPGASGPALRSPSPPTEVDAGAPVVDTPGVDVFLGPEGSAEARHQAEDMPVSAGVGPAVGGADPPEIDADRGGWVDDTLALLSGRPDDAAPAPPADADAEGAPIIARLLGGTP